MQTLKKGSKGEEVKTLQKYLGLTQDGIFGSNTEKVLKQFQSKNKLTPDGVCGPKTWQVLMSSTNYKCIDPSVIYLPLSSCITKSANRQIKYLVIHYTAGTSSAKGKARTLKTVWEKNKNASADFGVDDGEMVQFNPDLNNYYCWAVSGGNGITNKNSISIEICSNLKSGTSASTPNHEGWYYTEASLNNAITLAKLIMNKYNIPISRVVRHYDVTGKLCPGIVGWNDGTLYNTNGTKTNKKNNSTKWTAFKERLK